MVKLLIELLGYLRESAPLLTSLAVLTLLLVLLAKSIKKHSGLYYTLFAIPFVLVALPSLGKLFGIEIAGFVRVPFLGEIIRDYIHMGAFGHPLLIIIMYIGALEVRRPTVKKLMSIRKEMSIISGFAVFAHSLIRVMNSVPGAFRFFANNEEYMANTKVVSTLGAGFSSFSFLLGVFMLILFIPLWVTSFDAVRKRMGHVKWKKLQKWSYVLYVTLFIHAMAIQIGGMLNPRGGQTPKPAIETTVAQEKTTNRQRETARPVTNERRGETAKSEENSRQSTSAVKPATNGRMPTKGFADIKLNSQTKGYIHMISLILIYGSYLFLRIRKAKR
ncbi:ferric reductase-like transmembrane domain-containing protein [Parabacteroides sp. PF5-9]|uniref:ferric reductase-like transmembrane domain-containing protein n=1 Tax=Parabacteroides sp. PF5-9 TaxID=1742404 RepID=UPI002472E907|nr:ferric reductase-like transmembrane domain-containing protein [Parabacteroides sp. PF5-9]MDH6357654.1 DMSO/TMAO reductase YedYZ heme-binding membrane subunit [Parabacteroides sp. PF5-9]